MKNNDCNTKSINFVLVILIVWIVAFMWLGRVFHSNDCWGLMVIGAALITFFGFLQLPGSTNKSGVFQETRIRLAISATLIVAYLVYFGSIVYLDVGKDKETGEAVKTFAEDMLPTLTNLLAIILPFYFGSTAAVEVADKLSQNNGTRTKNKNT